MFILNTPNPIAFHMFGVPIYWYGIFMAAAIFTAIMTANVFFNKFNFKQYKDKIIENAVWIIFSGILGARFYYCLLNFQYYILRPLEIFNIRQGGLSIHGAILGGILCLLVVAKKTKIPVLRYLDAISVGTILGQAIGRWGNYFNSEAYGLPVKMQNWGVLIPASRRLPQYIDYGLYHPAFLYESMFDLIAFGILSCIFFKHAKNDGVTFCIYLIIYSLIRFFVEFIRIDSALNVGNVPIAVIVSVVLFLAGTCGLILILKNKQV